MDYNLLKSKKLMNKTDERSNTSTEYLHRIYVSLLSEEPLITDSNPSYIVANSCEMYNPDNLSQTHPSVEQETKPS